MDLGEIERGRVDWIGVTLSRDKWRASVKALLNLRVSWGNYRVATQLMGYLEGASSIELISSNNKM
jgi:hypothetical protein